MADFITPVVNIVTRLCGYCSKWADSISNLGEKLKSLGVASKKLKSMYLDVKMKVETAEQDPDPQLMVLNVVRDWMGKVEVLQKEVEAILPQADDEEIQAKCCGGRCPKNCRASYKLHKRVTHKLNDVNVLISSGRFEVVAEKFARDLFDKHPVDKAVGVESTYAELCSCFGHNKMGIIGLYGMGGVGKTTLLKKFNNDFLSTTTGYVVIWVVASKDADPGKIQDDIRKKLRLQDDAWNDKTMDDRALLLYNILIKKKFVLLLDDVWGRIDLLKLGVPSPNDHECKVIFTTRSIEVCGLMDAQRRIMVNCLPSNKAFELFKEKVGEIALKNPHILPLVKQVMDECQGLPLALCTVGRAMANKVTPNEWEHARDILRSHPSKVQGIVDDVYHLLEFSFDRLSDSSKSCFLYCALYPEDYNIAKEDLILLWIAEGFLAEFDYNIHEARKQGEDVISSLMYACLLENGDKENTVKMHDVIRDMALWIACDHEKRTRFFVTDCSVTSGLEVYNHPKWKEVEKLSIWGGGKKISNLSQKPHYPNLVTLLLGNAGIQVFPTEVFVLPNTIKVLDLSFNGEISILPSEIGNFLNLEHLNLSYTRIRKMPEELKNLKKLRFLLWYGMGLLDFPKGVICNLSSLQALRGGSIRVMGESGDDALLDELEGLDHIQDIRISVYSISCVRKILNSSKLQRCMCELFVQEKCSLVTGDLLSSLGKMEHLETLRVTTFYKKEDYEAVDIPRSSFWGHEYITSLRLLTLRYCHNIHDLSWLIHAPNLETLDLMFCESLVEVISEDFGATHIETVKSNLFHNLTYLHLEHLSKLRNICRMALQFPCLNQIKVIRCPNLEKLPFDSQSELKNLRDFITNPEWTMDDMQWEDKATKDLLYSKHSPAYDP